MVNIHSLFGLPFEVSISRAHLYFATPEKNSTYQNTNERRKSSDEKQTSRVNSNKTKKKEEKNASGFRSLAKVARQYLLVVRAYCN